jgi:methylated-DNA-[protein]-cysteine S-methyltransferase
MSEDAASYVHLPSPVGPLLIAGNEGRLCLISFAKGSRAAKPKYGWREDAGPLGEIIRQLNEYFDGVRTEFTLPLHFNGTPFQNAVWTALQEVPFGQTISYGELAMRVAGDITASRAVGAANGANPLPIVVPCHRVIGADGSLTGFGGGLPTKRFLLAHEQRIRPPVGLQYNLFE